MNRKSIIDPAGGYRIVGLANGTHSLHSLAYGETFHPVIGPVAEAEALYVRQLDLPGWLKKHEGEFVVWDVGLGAAANALTILRCSREHSCPLRMVSFDQTLEPLEFVLEHVDQFPYLRDYIRQVRELATAGRCSFQNGRQHVDWEFHLADFPTLLNAACSPNPSIRLPKPHLILFDAYSPAKNPTMWTHSIFAQIFKLLDPDRPCAMPTYSRATNLRVTLLLAGFFVGAGHATGKKEETTIATNSMNLLKEPLGARWLQRARQSHSAEPMWTPTYRQAPLEPSTWEKLRNHPQFVGAVASGDSGKHPGRG